MRPALWRRQAPKACRRWARTLALAAPLIVLAVPGHGQELEPRAYSPSPVGTHFAVANYTHLNGEVLTDPALPIKNVQAKIDLYMLGYVHTFALAGRTASVGVVVPYARGDVSGEVFEAARVAHRAGIGDTRLRLALNLYGNPALAPREFAQRESGLAVGASLVAIVPTGHYVGSRLVNVGSNRWALKPEVGASYPLGNWFLEASAGTWLYADNTDFFGGRRRSQEALHVTQVHAGYNFRPGLWMALNVGRFSGGRSTVDGVTNNDAQDNTRLGVTLSVPFTHGWSGKIHWSRGIDTHAGGDFSVLALALQYRWFDR